MIDTHALIQENKQWHDEHAQWLEEVNRWQDEAERLVAMLYRIERAIPDHSSLLNKHIAMIETHENRISSYECGIEQHCLETCPDFKTQEQQEKFHAELRVLHERARQDHEKIRRLYIGEMERFRKLLLELLQRC